MKRQGPHQGAQKSTITGTVALSTVLAKLASVSSIKLFPIPAQAPSFKTSSESFAPATTAGALRLTAAGEQQERHCSGHDCAAGEQQARRSSAALVRLDLSHIRPWNPHFFVTVRHAGAAIRPFAGRFARG